MTIGDDVPLSSDRRREERRRRFKNQQNNFGVLRLFLAALVIIGHAPEILDGNSRRDLLQRTVGQGTLGTLAVTGFFLLSGYLITMSMLRTNDVREYLSKRVLRIVPGFVVAYVLTVFVLAPLLGAPVGAAWRDSVVNMLWLGKPPLFFDPVPPWRTINGALWTINYEFRCYLVIAILWLCGMLQRRRSVLALALGMGLAALAVQIGRVVMAVDSVGPLPYVERVLGWPSVSILFTFTFLLGACAYLYRDVLLPRLSGRVAAAATIGSIALLAVPKFGLVLYLPLFGAALFWLALKADLGRVQRINDRWDISYGVYLYGWPSAMIVIVLWPGVPAAVLAVLSLALAVIAGTASWFLVERWFKLRDGKLFGRRSRRLRPADQPAV